MAGQTKFKNVCHAISYENQVNDMNKKQSMFAKEYAWRGLMTAGGLLVIVITICIGAFLVYKGSGTFTIFHHSLSDFLFSADWKPADNAEGGGTVGALIFIVGSLCTCGLALLIATPFALGSAIFMIEIAPKFGEKFYRPIVEIFAGIPSVVYGLVGMIVLVPTIREMFDLSSGASLLAAIIVLAIMILPSIINVSENALNAVPKEYEEASLALGATKSETIFKVSLPAGRSGVATAVVLGVGRAIGEAMAIIMVSGNVANMPGLFTSVRFLTTAIASEMSYAAAGSLQRQALFSIGLVLFLFIMLINVVLNVFIKNKKEGA